MDRIAIIEMVLISIVSVILVALAASYNDYIYPLTDRFFILSQIFVVRFLLQFVFRLFTMCSGYVYEVIMSYNQNTLLKLLMLIITILLYRELEWVMELLIMFRNLTSFKIISQLQAACIL